MWKFNIPRNPESTSADTGTGSRVNVQTVQSQPALTENPRRTPEVYKPLKQNTEDTQHIEDLKMRLGLL